MFKLLLWPVKKYKSGKLFQEWPMQVKRASIDLWMHEKSLEST